MASIEDLIATISGGLHAGQQGNDIRDLHVSFSRPASQPDLPIFFVSFLYFPYPVSPPNDVPLTFSLPSLIPTGQTSTDDQQSLTAACPSPHPTMYHNIRLSRRYAPSRPGLLMEHPTAECRFPFFHISHIQDQWRWSQCWWR